MDFVQGQTDEAHMIRSSFDGTCSGSVLVLCGTFF